MIQNRLKALPDIPFISELLIKHETPAFPLTQELPHFL